MPKQDKRLSEKEKRILEAAIEVFVKKGFSASTTSEIAGIAGVAEGTIFRYFKTKKQLLLSILAQTIDVLGSRIVLKPIGDIFEKAEEIGLKQTLSLLLHDRVKLFEDNITIFRIILSEALYHDDLREMVVDKVIEKGIVLISDFCNKMKEKKMLRPDIAPEAFVRVVMGSAAALIVQRQILGDKLKLNSLDEEIDIIVDIILNGIGAG